MVLPRSTGRLWDTVASRVPFESRTSCCWHWLWMVTGPSALRDSWEDEAAVSVESGGCSLFCGVVQPQRGKKKREHRQRAAMGFIAASFPAGEIPAR